MISSLPYHAVARLRKSRLAALSKAKDGIAAIEFALLAPVMIGMYFGVTEIAMAIIVDRNISHSTNVVGDLATQVASLDKAGIEDVMNAALAVAAIPAADVSKITIELNSYEEASDGTRTRIGYARLGPAISSGPATYDHSQLGARLLNSNSGVLVARVDYRYTPVTYKFMNNVVLNETFILKPRQSETVPFKQGGTNSFTCTAGSNMKVTC